MWENSVGNTRDVKNPPISVETCFSFHLDKSENQGYHVIIRMRAYVYTDTSEVDLGNITHIFSDMGYHLCFNVGNIYKVIYKVKITVFSPLIWTT